MKSTSGLKTVIASAVMATVVLSAPLQADDIEVFSAGVTPKPNILFVFDRSGSMEKDVNGNDASNWEERRSVILQTAFADLLEKNKDKINAGLGPFYRKHASGVKWPVGDLNQDASEIDPDIPADEGWTSQVIIDRLFESSGDWGNTNIVDALYQSLLYFRGDPVRAGGGSWDPRFRPDVWDADNEQFIAGEYRAPHPSTYTPRNAFNPTGVALPDQSGTCQDFTLGGTVSGYNGCDSSSYDRYDSCSYVAEQPGTGTQCGNWEYQCSKENVDGQCTTGGWSCEYQVPASATAEHNVCTWYKEDRTEGSWAGANYQSPITDSCQANFIVLLSDGDPTEVGTQSEVKTMAGVDSCQDLSTTTFASADAEDANDGDCGIELVDYASKNDQISTIPNSVVKTYTIGFGTPTPGQSYLRQLAVAGGGEFYAASDASELSDAFDNIINSISGETETFTALAVDINKASFSHDNRAFFSLFSPSGKRSWQGNLKGYFLESDGLVDVDGVPAIVNGAGGAVFKDTARSFWSSGIDGNDVLAGGAVDSFDPDSRNLYTFTGDSVPADGADLTEEANWLVGTNTNILPEWLQGEDKEIVDWVRTAPIADPLHTQPITISYEDKTVVYMMTNQGLLHAFDATSPTVVGDHVGGSELWAFMPQELLKNIPELRADQSTGEHIYGLDGGMTRWLIESGDANGVIESGEDAILLLGMRRGGSHYYAIDVSDPETPKLKWKIVPGQGDYLRLGQSWSRMSLVTMNVSGTPKKVLVFGGGYDEVLDGRQQRLRDTTTTPVKGNDIYLVDAELGTVIWSANNLNTHTEMRYAIPSDVNVIDSTGDGLADRAYVGDLGGQVWRMDFNQGAITSTGGVTLTRLAELATDSSFQPFFYRPSVSLVRARGDNYFSIAIGSGSRDNPLSPSAQNAMFVLKDKNIDAGAPSDLSELPLAVDDLYNATANNAGSSDSDVASTAKNSLMEEQGWYISLAAGEKVLAEPNVLQNELHFTTFAPDLSGASTSNPCAAAGTVGRYYRVDAVDATPVANLDADPSDTSLTPLTTSDRSTIVSNHGIPGPATMVFPEGSNGVQVYVDKNKVTEVPQQLFNVLWYKSH